MSNKTIYQKLGDYSSIKSQHRKSQQEVDQHNPQTSTINVTVSTRKAAHPNKSPTSALTPPSRTKNKNLVNEKNPSHNPNHKTFSKNNSKTYNT